MEKSKYQVCEVHERSGQTTLGEPLFWAKVKVIPQSEATKECERCIDTYNIDLPHTCVVFGSAIGLKEESKSSVEDWEEKFINLLNYNPVLPGEVVDVLVDFIKGTLTSQEKKVRQKAIARGRSEAYIIADACCKKGWSFDKFLVPSGTNNFIYLPKNVSYEGVKKFDDPAGLYRIKFKEENKHE